MNTDITIIRHGETEWNVSMRLQGSGNSALTARGIQQAELTAKALKNHKFKALISSDQQRALQTAEIINRFHGLPIIREPGIRERNFGIMEGLTREEILEKYPEVHAGYMKRRETYQIPEGESLVQFFQRVKNVLQGIVDTYREKQILVVTHGGILDCIMRLTFNIPLGASRNFSIHNAAINHFLVSSEKWFLQEWGNTNHLR